MTRTQQIDKGHIWQVHLDGNDDVIFEGGKTACLTFIRTKYGMRQYKKGTVRLCKVIYEPEPL